MLVLHTSDWHLGRSLHRADLREAQAAFLDDLVDTVRSERVDVVVVSGDVYDRALPPLDAVALCEQALVRLRDAGARVVVISGNHDSPRRLGFGSALVDAAGVHLRTGVAGLAEPVLVEDAAGVVAFYAVPFLEPELVSPELTALPDAPAEADEPAVRPRGQAAALARAMAAVQADRSRRRAARAVVLAHTWVAGGEPSESEREIGVGAAAGGSVGGVGQVPLGLFGGIDYVALGHLHGPQVLADGVRYSGSPLAYSFGEARQAKASWLVELDAGGLRRVERVPAPVPRRLSTLSGRLDELLASPAHAAVEHDFLSVTLTDPGRPVDAMARLRRRFPHVLVLEHRPDGAAVSSDSYRSRVQGRADAQILAEFVAHVRGTPASSDEVRLLTAALDSARRVESEVA